MNLGLLFEIEDRNAIPQEHHNRLEDIWIATVLLRRPVTYHSGRPEWTLSDDRPAPIPLPVFRISPYHVDMMVAAIVKRFGTMIRFDYISLYTATLWNGYAGDSNSTMTIIVRSDRFVECVWELIRLIYEEGISLHPATYPFAQTRNDQQRAFKKLGDLLNALDDIERSFNGGLTFYARCMLSQIKQSLREDGWDFHMTYRSGNTRPIYKFTEPRDRI